ncbi:hypothetical protein [Chitinophaga caseinilytica]
MSIYAVYLISAIVLFCLYRIAAYHAHSEVKLKKAAGNGRRKALRVRA